MQKIKHDVNGNPRFVVHFLEIASPKDEEKAKEWEQKLTPFKFSTSHLYDICLSKARKLGGKKFHNKQFGGGIVFQAYESEMPGIIEQLKNL